MESGIHIVSSFGAEREFSTHNPATGEPVAQYPVASGKEVDAAVARAREAHGWWQALRQPRRSAALRRVAALLAEERTTLARAITSESGKPMQEALLSDVMVAADAAVFCAEHASAAMRGEEISHDNPALKLKRGRLVWRPLGVIGIISPWNYPLSIPAADTFAALATGNTVVVKPSELTPRPVLELERLLAKALEAEGLGGKPGPLQVVTGLCATGEALIAAAIDKLIFTGSVATGRKVAVAAAERLLPVVLELGGKDAMVVLADANLEAASSAAVWGAMMNAGQTCISVERCYVDRSIYSRFLGLCLDKINRLRVGNGAEPDTDVGPLITNRQLRIVEQQVEEARSLGATVHTGGRALPELGPNYYAPTLITDVNHSMSLMTEETFGPVLPVMPFSGDDEAVALANDSSFGLAGSVWGANAHATRVAGRVEAGAVMINDLLSGFAVSGAPHGGLRLSGIGRSHGMLGMRELLRPVYLDTDLLPGMKKLWWYPYAGNLDAMAAFTELLHARDLRSKARAALRALPAFFHKRH
jgi:succinate-semialdehyde dehydrogenase/glutarate-semialdehyde dehydrogenase